MLHDHLLIDSSGDSGTTLPGAQAECPSGITVETCLHEPRLHECRLERSGPFSQQRDRCRRPTGRPAGAPPHQPRAPHFLGLVDTAYPLPSGRLFPTALDPFTCNRYEIADFTIAAADAGVRY